MFWIQGIHFFNSKTTGGFSFGIAKAVSIYQVMPLLSSLLVGSQSPLNLPVGIGVIRSNDQNKWKKRDIEQTAGCSRFFGTYRSPVTIAASLLSARTGGFVMYSHSAEFNKACRIATITSIA